LADEGFDFFRGRDSGVRAVFGQEGEAGEVAEAIIGDANYFAGVVLVVLMIVAGMMRMAGMRRISGDVAVRR
jgi:hypothetical protein